MKKPRPAKKPITMRSAGRNRGERSIDERAWAGSPLVATKDGVPCIYDITIDRQRPVTTADVQMLLKQAAIASNLRGGLHRLMSIAEHEGTMAVGNEALRLLIMAAG